VGGTPRKIAPTIWEGGPAKVSGFRKLKSPRAAAKKAAKIVDTGPSPPKIIAKMRILIQALDPAYAEARAIPT
jgi:hypothetical protein